ncbi:MAG TPA: hypothetical protein VM891_06425 [Amaricoccus sp.]|nr:hypothetical protein [Amaricoccus sp.]
MRPLYIHVGQPKTGTSSIQRFLVDHRAALLAAGLGLGPYMTLPTGKSRPLREAIRTRGLAATMDALAASPGEALAISSEHFCSILLDTREAEAIRDAARRHFRPVVVVFLRRQDFWHESLYAESVKTFYDRTIEAYAAEVLADGPEHDYDACLARLERVFGPEALRVRLFHDSGPNDVVAEFLAAVGLAGRDLGPASPPPRQNASPHRRKVLFLGQVPKPDPAIQDLSAFMATVVQKTRAIADDGERFLLAPPERHRLVARQAAGNRAVLARYGLDDRGQFASPPDPRDAWRPPRPITAGERQRVLAEALGAAARLRGRRFALRMAGKVATLYLRMPRG